MSKTPRSLFTVVAGKSDVTPVQPQSTEMNTRTLWYGFTHNVIEDIVTQNMNLIVKSECDKKTKKQNAFLVHS